MLNFKETTLDNGLKIVTCPLENTKAVTILILFGVGSRFESANLNGISHFLEHMFFKGTDKRPTTLDISRELDSVGASYNAYTGEEYTGYFVHVPSNHFDLGLDVLTDMLFNSKFDAEELEREKGVIIEEINMYNDDPKAKVELVARDLVYPDQPLGRNIAGEKEIVKKIDRETMTNYRAQYYTPQNTVVVVAGGMDHEDWLKKLNEKFGAIQSGQKNQAEPAREEQTAPQVRVFTKETDQANLILGFRSISRLNVRRPALRVLTNLMGQMMSSRLFIEVREKRGLCYYVNADMMDFQDTGFWAVSAGVDPARAEEAVKVILTEIEKLKTEPISDEELNRAKENLKGHLYLSLEDSMAVASFLGEQALLWPKIEDPEGVASKFDKVTKEQIQEIAKELFVPESLNLAVVGPYKNDEKFQEILNNFK